MAVSPDNFPKNAPVGSIGIKDEGMKLSSTRFFVLALSGWFVANDDK